MSCIALHQRSSTLKIRRPLRFGKEPRDRLLHNRSGVTGKEGLFFVEGNGWELRSRMSKLHASTEHGLEVRGGEGVSDGTLRSRMSKHEASTEHGLEVRGGEGVSDGTLRSRMSKLHASTEQGLRVRRGTRVEKGENEMRDRSNLVGKRTGNR